MRFPLPIIGIALGATAIPAAAQNYQVVDRIAAVVGDVAIPQSRVEEQLLERRSQGEVPDDPAELAALRQQILEDLIENQLMVAAAEADTAVEVTEEQVAQRVDERIRGFRERLTPSEYQQALLQAGIGTPDEHRRMLTEQFRAGLLRETLTQYLTQTQQLNPIPPTEAEMREYFDEQSTLGALGERPPTVSFRQIVIRPEPDSSAIRAAFAEADSVLNLVRADRERFAELARAHSDDPTNAETGGSLGWFRRGQMVPEFEQIAFRLAPGQFAPSPVITPYGFHVLQVTRTEAAEIEARHILVTPEVTEENRQAALALADSILTALRTGTDFDSLVRAFHDSEEESLLDGVPIADVRERYGAVFDSSNSGDLIGPVTLQSPTEPKYAVVVLDEKLAAGQWRFDEWRERIRSFLAEQNGVNRYIEELRKATYVEVLVDQQAVGTPQ
jgi:peptidyl-prolyl cis-trans isomerase SurA